MSLLLAFQGAPPAEPDLILGVVDADGWDGEQEHEDAVAVLVVEPDRVDLALSIEDEVDVEPDEQWLTFPAIEDLVAAPQVDDQEIEEAFALPQRFDDTVQAEDLVLLAHDPDAQLADLEDGEAQDYLERGMVPFEDPPVAPEVSDYIVRARRRGRR